MLNLDTRVDLNEVVSVLLINQELRSACIAISSSLGQSDGIREDAVTNIGGKVLGRGNLDDLLVSSLDRAVTLVQMDNVAMVVTEKLDLNMLGLVKEALNKNGTIAEGSLGLGGGALEVLLQGLLLTDDSHTTTATTISSLDDDGEAVLVGEFLDLLISLDSTWGTRDDRDVGLVGEVSGRNLVAERINDIGGGTDELVVGVSARAC